MKTYIYSFLIFAASLLTSCGGNINPETNIATSRNAINNNDFATALSSLNEAKAALTDSTATSPSASALTEIAALYCVIDDHMQSDDNIVNALVCYELALKINPDSVKHCFDRLSDDEKCQIDKLDKLRAPSGNNSDLYENDVDSLLFDHNDVLINDIDILE